MTLGQIERAIEKSEPADRRKLLSHLAKRYQKDLTGYLDEENIENLGWMILSQSSLKFWDNTKDAIYDRV